MKTQVLVCGLQHFALDIRSLFSLTTQNIIYCHQGTTARRKGVFKVVAAVKQHQLCMLTCPEKLHVSPTYSVTCFPSTYFVFCFDEPSVQEFEAAINKVLLFVFILQEMSGFFDGTHRQSCWLGFYWWEMQIGTHLIYSGELLQSVEQYFSVTKQDYATFVTWFMLLMPFCSTWFWCRALVYLKLLQPLVY